MSEEAPDELELVAGPARSAPARAPSQPSRVRVVSLIGELGHGGSERQLLLLLKHLDPARFECRVIVFNRNPQAELIEELEHCNVSVEAVPPEIKSVAKRLIYLYRVLSRWRPHVVHSWTSLDNPYAEIVGRAVGARARFGSLRTTLNSTLMISKTEFQRWLILHGARRLVVNSKQCVGELVEAGIDAERVALLRNCVEINNQQSADVSDLGIAPHHRVVGWVANLRAVKDPLFFVEAMAKIVPDFPELRALLVGQKLASEPELPQRIEQRIRDLGLEDRVVMAGFRPDIPQLMRRLDICCLTSAAEGMPNAILEAMAAARPVVATRVGGVPELVTDGENGFLVELGDVRGFAAAVSRLLREPDLARRMGLRGQERAGERHDCADAAGRLGDLYLEALGRSVG